MPRNKNIFEGVDVPELQSSVTGESEIEFHPINPLISGEPIQFDIPESFTQMTDPNFLLKISCKITEGDGTQLKDDARVGPVNLTLHALFKDVVLKANGVIINQATGTYPYRAMIETTYTYSTAAKNGAVGIPQMYYKDQAGKFEAVEKDVNPGFDRRVEKFAKSVTVVMAGRIHCDLLLQNKLVIPGIRFSLSFFPSDTKFHLMSGTAAPAEKLVISSIVIKIRRINLNSSAILGIEKALQSKPAQYPISHAVVRTTNITPGQSHLSNFVLHNGQIPRLIIVTLIKGSSFTGSYVRNPFNFTVRDCKSAQITIGGRLIPSLPYSPSISMIEPYLNSLRMVRKLYTDSDTGITLDDFLANGYEILPFDLSPDEGGIPSRSNGVVSFSGHWSPTTFDDSYLMLFYLLWDNVISIDSRKNVILDYIP